MCNVRTKSSLPQKPLEQLRGVDEQEDGDGRREPLHQGQLQPRQQGQSKLGWHDSSNFENNRFI